LGLQRKTAFWRFPPLHQADLEGQAKGRLDPFAFPSGNVRYLRIPAIGSAPGGNSFTALLFGRLYGRRIKLYRGIHLRRAVPSFTVELRRRPRLATNSSQNPRLSETKILQAPLERGSHRVEAAAFEANTSTSPANVAPAQPTGRILQCLVPDETPRGQPREVLLSSPSSDLTSVPRSRRRARASGGGDQTKKLPRNSESSPIEITAVQETRSTAHRSSSEPTGEMTGVTLSGPTVASNQVFESSGGRALIPNAKGRRETQVSLDGSADPLVKDRQSDTKIDIVTTPVPTVVEPPRQSRQRNIMARYVFGEELGPGERWKRRLITR
jgi:hypothetical protein